MTNQEEHMDFEEMCKQSERSHKRGKVFGGILVVIAGSLFLGRELGAEIPHWMFTWKAFLIALGLLIGVKHNFRNAGWFFSAIRKKQLFIGTGPRLGSLCTNSKWSQYNYPWS